MSNVSQNLSCPHCTYVGAKSERGLNVHIGRAHKRVARQRFKHHKYTKHPSAPQSESKALSMTCPECKAGGFKSGAHLGRHRRSEHHIPGREVQRALRNANLSPRERSSADASIAAPQNEQQFNPSTVDTSFALSAVTHAIAVGSVKEFCRHFAEEHGYPAKQFTREFAELFLREAFR